jgi:integrase
VTRLTDTLIRSATSDGATSYVWDEGLRNFGFRVTKTGTKTFVVLLGGGRRQSIGRYPMISLAEARAEAKRILARKALGHIRPQRVAHEDAVAAFLKECTTKNRPRTVADYRRHLRRHFAFERKAIGDVTKRDIIRRLDGLIETPSERHHAFVVARAFYRWCVRQGYIDASPLQDMSMSIPASTKERVLSDDELARLWSVVGAGNETFHQIVACLILTGQRRGEIASLQWDYVDTVDRLITLPAETTKNRRTHRFPYSDQLARIIANIPNTGAYLFPAARLARDTTTTFNGWGRPKARLDHECDVHGWTLHDLRRTFSSNMAKLGIQQVVVEKLLNHVSGGTQSPIAQVYNRHQYLDEMRQAILLWDQHVTSLPAPKG